MDAGSGTEDADIAQRRELADDLSIHRRANRQDGFRASGPGLYLFNARPVVKGQFAQGPQR
ncbi:MAG: hypothetical protein M5U15_00210 [Kiritimatiellae bacterium]|nr:hypothetical protein [Kiritimatiellia bacterium]